MYQRKIFNFTPPIREIVPQDGEQSFQNEFQESNTDVLDKLTNMNIENRYVIVYELNGKILGFLTFLDKGDHFHLDLVETNRLHDESNIVKPGPSLLVVMEGISRTFGFNKISLHSTQKNLDLYHGLGYSISGNDFNHPTYGILTPMEKSLV